MNSISTLFDFDNESDNILANDSLKPIYSIDDMCMSSDPMLSFKDFIDPAISCDLLFSNIPITKEQLQQLNAQTEKNNHIKPFIKIVDLNDYNDNDMQLTKPKPSIVIGIKGDF